MRVVTRRARIALLLVALIVGAAAHFSIAQPGSSERPETTSERSFRATAQHRETATVPARAMTRARAVVKVMSAPLAGMLAMVAMLALLAVWCTTTARRRDRLAPAVVTYRRRGPPNPLPVS